MMAWGFESRPTSKNFIIMNKKLTDPIERFDELSEETQTNFINAWSEFSRQCTIGFMSLRYTFISILESSLVNGRNMYQLLKTITTTARTKYLNAKWYNRWYYKKAYLKAIRKERAWRDNCNNIERDLIKEKEKFMGDLSKT